MSEDQNNETTRLMAVENLLLSKMQKLLEEGLNLPEDLQYLSGLSGIYTGLRETEIRSQQAYNDSPEAKKEAGKKLFQSLSALADSIGDKDQMNDNGQGFLSHLLD